ncbi:MAG: hypothetical protein JSU87_05355 [Gemmatimonadota bacterium]|nr:MAG: hypothetical protein JSU87_05355 [Gemmatimonadota bacterium]
MARMGSEGVPRVLLTGRPGCGKTTAIKRAVALIKPHSSCGFYTEEVRKGGQRIGFDVVTCDGRRAALARVGAPGPRVSRYGVDVAAFEALAVAPLELMACGSSRLVVIDEIGKMELLSERFVLCLDRIFAPGSEQPVLGSIMRGRHPVADRLRHRSDVRILPVTPDDRDSLPPRLAALFGT